MQNIELFKSVCVCVCVCPIPPHEQDVTQGEFICGI